MAELLAEGHRADDAAGEHRADGADGGGRRLAGGDRAAVALHDQERPLQSPAAQAAVERAEVVPQAGADLRAHDRRRVARELPDPGAHLVGQGDEDVRVRLVDELAEPPLVGRVLERPEQGDRDRAQAVVQERADGLAGLVLVERDDDVAVAVDPLGDLQRVLLRQQPVRLALAQDVLQLVRRAAEVPALDVHDVDRVPVAPGREEADRRHVAHHQRIERGRRPVGDVVGVREHVLQRSTELLGEGLEHVEHSARVVRWSRGSLRREDRSRVVVQHGVGERPADVHPDHIGHGALPCSVPGGGGHRPD